MTAPASAEGCGEAGRSASASAEGYGETRRCENAGRPPAVVFDEVSKFYGEVLGVNRVTLNIPPGITSLVGPNGSGKTTLMNLMTGLIHPDHGRILMRGISPRDPESLMRITGYATQYDTAPRWATGFTFITTGLLLFGYGRAEAEEKAWKALERLGLTDAANRKVAAYSKGMRQRVRLAQAIAHDPDLLVLDEPLNGLDPLVRAETIDLFRSWAEEGRHVIISSHVLQEVDLISDQVVLIANGMIMAEGKIRDVRDEIEEHPSQYLRPLPRCVRGSGAVVRRGPCHRDPLERRSDGHAGDDAGPGAVRARARAHRPRRPPDRRRRAGRRERGCPVRVPDWRRVAWPFDKLGPGRRGRSRQSSFAVPSSPSARCGCTGSRFSRR